MGNKKSLPADFGGRLDGESPLVWAREKTVFVTQQNLRIEGVSAAPYFVPIPSLVGRRASLSCASL